MERARPVLEGDAVVGAPGKDEVTRHDETDIGEVRGTVEPHPGETRRIQGFVIEEEAAERAGFGFGRHFQRTGQVIGQVQRPAEFSLEEIRTQNELIHVEEISLDAELRSHLHGVIRNIPEAQDAQAGTDLSFETAAPGDAESKHDIVAPDLPGRGAVAVADRGAGDRHLLGLQRKAVHQRTKDRAERALPGLRLGRAPVVLPPNRKSLDREPLEAQPQRRKSLPVDPAPHRLHRERRRRRPDIQRGGAELHALEVEVAAE